MDEKTEWEIADKIGEGYLNKLRSGIINFEDYKTTIDEFKRVYSDISKYKILIADICYN